MISKIENRSVLFRLIILWLFIIGAWSIYRLNFISIELVEEIIIKPIIFILPLFVFLRLEHKKINLKSLGLHIESWEKVILWGAIVGVLLSLEMILVSFLKGEVIDPGLFSIGFVSANLLVSGATAFWEELLYRGFFLNHLQKIFTNLTWSNIISAVGFSLGHLPIAIAVLHYQNLELVVYLVLVLILGLINGFVFQKTGNIFAGVIVHILWNFTVGFF